MNKAEGGRRKAEGFTPPTSHLPPRLPGWETRLTHWASARLGSPFEWGETDCALIVAEAVDALRGTSLPTPHASLLTPHPSPGGEAARYRGRWRTAAQAARFQRREGLDLAVWLAAVGAFRWQGMPLFGDVIVHPHPAGPWVVGHVVLRGGYVITAAEEHGVYLGRQEHALAQSGAQVWRIA